VTDTRAREDAYRALFDAQFRPILGYALRRTAGAADAADVAAETLLIAWRRFDEVPAGAEARLWLYGVARRVLANHQRGEVRRERLGARFREHLETVIADPADAVVLDTALRAALAQLGEADRELVTLSVWEELEPREIATVLGVSAEVVRTRLRRARIRLRDLLAGHDEPSDGHAGVGELALAREEAPPRTNTTSTPSCVPARSTTPPLRGCLSPTSSTTSREKSCARPPLCTQLTVPHPFLSHPVGPRAG
jgi:RNA polymerase sigma-70 factor (ECF subfamily)